MQKQFAFISMLYLLAKLVLLGLIWMVTIQIQKKALDAKRRREALRASQHAHQHAEEAAERESIRPEDYPFRR
ncbi:MAG: hypothetical protein QHH05_09885 [Syntrophomonadaceae bacterium]|jgi:hypothetical protein|nr:hypothetical protein [Syntrophomonadaceae bacterium]